MKSRSGLQAKLDKQRAEIARLTEENRKLKADKVKLLEDIKWMRGEK